MLNIDKLRWELWDKPFIDLIGNLKRTETENYILFYVNDGSDWFFEYDKENNFFYVQYNRVWLALAKKLGFSGLCLVEYIELKLKKHYGFKNILIRSHASLTKKIR